MLHDRFLGGIGILVLDRPKYRRMLTHGLPTHFRRKIQVVNRFRRLMERADKGGEYAVPRRLCNEGVELAVEFRYVGIVYRRLFLSLHDIGEGGQLGTRPMLRSQSH